MEQIAIDILYFLLHDLFQFACYFVYLTLFLTPKYNRAVVVLIPTAIAFLPPVYALFDDRLISFFVLLCLMILTSLFAFEEKPVICMFAAAIELISLGGMSIPVAVFIIPMLGYFPTEISPKTWGSVLFTIFLDILMVVTFSFMLLIWNKAFKRKNIKTMGSFLLFPLGQAMFMLACVYTATDDLQIDFASNPLLNAAMGVSLASDVLMLIALNENDNAQNMKLRMEQLEKDMERQLKYYEALSEQFETIREYSHDIRNMVATAKALPLAENSRRDRELLIQGMEEKTENLSVPIYCSSPLINAVLWQKSREAEKAGVALTTDIMINSDFNPDRVDICSLLVNLLDNAIEEAAQTHGEVHFSISQSAGLTFFETENPSVRVIKANTPRPKTRKTGDHGHGTVILKKIAEKYGGTYALSADGKTAHAVVSLRL